MSTMNGQDAPLAKRRKVNHGNDEAGDESTTESETDPTIHLITVKSPLRSLGLEISPPPVRSASASQDASQAKDTSGDHAEDHQETAKTTEASTSNVKFIKSPVQLTRIQDLPASSNVDTIDLTDLLGDPLIKECWQFNFLFDVDFVMSSFDRDVRDLIKVKIVHGMWKREDARRMYMEEAAQRYPNLQLICAHMPEPFGTHHSKMMILLRHDDTAQIVIHTANMIPKDWKNMCQAVWRSPLLPLFAPDSESGPPSSTSHPAPVGSGARFKADLIHYLRAYETRTRSLRGELLKYDFSSVRAALISSVPKRQALPKISTPPVTPHGWPGLRLILSHIPTLPSVPTVNTRRSKALLVTQVSSIATLGSTEKWFSPFHTILSTSEGWSGIQKVHLSPTMRRPDWKIVFPTADEVRRSLDGYESGGSIHFKIASEAQRKQVEMMRGMLCHWAGHENDSSNASKVLAGSSGKTPAPADTTTSITMADIDIPRQVKPRHALRRRAAPHIKTYIRFSDRARMDSIDWAMVTSANLSRQAWGEMEKDDAARVSSYEIGVVVWPSLFADDFGKEEGSDENDGSTGVLSKEKVKMVPLFGRDTPRMEDLGEDQTGNRSGTKKMKIVGFRMPYDLPLVPYGKGEDPWCATANNREPDWKGVVWEGWSAS